MPEEGFVSVIIPTYNESANIAELLFRLISILDISFSGEYEILVIDDDSPDGTAELAEKAISGKGLAIRRKSGKKSLSLSVLDGIRQAKGEILVVMDADGSHPPEAVPKLINAVRQGYDLAVASRYVAGGGTSGFPWHRRIISRVACLLARPVTPIKDSTSGFFAVQRSCLKGVSLTPSGFKIGAEVFVKAKTKNFIEIPYIFADRKKGKSKMSLKQVLQYLGHLVSLWKYKNSSCSRR